MSNTKRQLITILLLLLSFTLFSDTNPDGDKLLDAAEHGDIELVKELLAKGVDVNYSGDWWATAFYMAIYNSHLELAKYLRARGAKIGNLEAEYNDPADTQLLNNIYKGNNEVVEYLISLGVNVNTVDNYLINPLLISINKRNYYITELLLKAGANPFEVNYSGYSALHLAVNSDNSTLIRLLKKYGHYRNYRWITAGPGLRMRNSPSLQGKKLLVIPYGSMVELLEERGALLTIAGESGYWTKVRWRDIEGWVFGGFLSKRYELDMETLLTSTVWSQTIDDDRVAVTVLFKKDKTVLIMHDHHREHSNYIMGEWSYNPKSKKLDIKVTGGEALNEGIKELNYRSLVFDPVKERLSYSDYDISAKYLYAIPASIAEVERSWGGR